MKKTLLALAVSSMALSISAQAENQFYGKINAATVYEDESGVFAVESFASRVGIKGSEDLGSSSLIFQAEYETDIDAGDTVLKQRDSYIGLAYKGAGTVKMGIMDTPLKKSQGKFDLFNDVIDIKKVVDGENRMGNSVNYTSEMMGSLQASVSVTLPEDGTSEGISASLVYKEGPIYAALATDSNVKEEAIQRVTVIYNMGDLSVGALINNVDSADTAATGDELAVAVNASMKMDANTLKVQLETGDQKALGAQSLSFGVDHKLAKTTKAYAYFNQYSEDNSVNDTTALAFGLEHKF